MTIEEEQANIIAEFDMFDDWMDKYNYLIELGKTLPIIDADHRNERFLIEGCQSRVWLQADEVDGNIYFKADSDAIITKGIIALLIRVFSGHTPAEILAAKLDYIDQIGLKDHLSPTRSNGLTSMIKQIKLYAMAYQSKQQ